MTTSLRGQLQTWSKQTEALDLAQPLDQASKSQQLSEGLDPAFSRHRMDGRVVLLEDFFSPWCPSEIVQLIANYFTTSSFIQPFSPVPFPATWSCSPSDKVNLKNQFLAFYHHCQQRSSPSRESCLKGRKTDVYTLDLVSHNLVEESRREGTVRIRNIFIEKWVESQKFSVPGGLHELIRQAQKWTFELVRNGERGVAVYYLKGSKGIPLNKIPYIFLAGNEFERHELPNPSTSLSNDKTWDHWKDEMGTEISTIRSVIFPLFVKAINHIFSVFPASSVLDVGGCDGDLGFFLLEECPKIRSYTIIEKSESLLKRAQHRSQCDCEFLSENRKKLTSIHGNFRTLEILKATGGKQSDVIILSGVIAEHVLSRSDSLALVENCKRSLKDHGFLLVAAYSSHHFGSSDYRRMGFKVINKSFSFIDGKTPMSIPFYILQKKNS